MSSEPGCFLMRSLSPVSRLSFTSASPETTTASAGIWSPRPKRMMSSSTIWSRSSSTSAPSRTAMAFLEVSSVSLSTIFLDRMDWMTPIAVLRNTTNRNVRFLNEPVKMTRNAKITLIKLNSVQRFSMMSSLTDLVLSSMLRLILPAAMRSSTSAVESPRSISVAAIPRPITSRRYKKNRPDHARFGRSYVRWCPMLDSNQRPSAPEADALIP